MVEIHGHLDGMRCSGYCDGIQPIPDELNGWEHGGEFTDTHRDVLTCADCGLFTRPHVLWFDEFYDEENFGIQTAHNRQRPEHGPDAPIRMPLTERLRLEDLIEGYTLNGAIQLRMDADIGSIEAGKLADFVVLDQNLFEIDRYRIQDVEPDAVVMEGRLIHGELN